VDVEFVLLDTTFSLAELHHNVFVLIHESDWRSKRGTSLAAVRR
jgi:hypothetical protein